ncbi:leucyl/phenylalanyl-tRNA--protein transferase [Puniceicoccaceae bacterium K14]|nr:leucyl/phenylalanyl-tRNA--protein transferase [Puniceicoccaceae bacterium K14]
MPYYQLSDSDTRFPDPQLAESDGLIAVGGDLNPERLINAYASGIFPWYSEDQPILWFSPNPRLILYPQKFKLSDSLRRIVKSKKFSIKMDTRFEEVIRSCSKAPRPDQDGTWITEDMVQAYIKLHKMGIAHSFEAYQKDSLVGGLYGISLGNAFFGESMFHSVANASKVAFHALVTFCNQNNFSFIDAQVPTEHLKSLGAEEVSRELFLELLDQCLGNKTKQGSWSHSAIET